MVYPLKIKRLPKNEIRTKVRKAKDTIHQEVIWARRHPNRTFSEKEKVYFQLKTESLISIPAQ
jgi:hypothetical protein